MRSTLLTLLVPLAATLAAAEEIAVEALRSPFCLIGQNVTVTVAERMSLVEGQYEFKYVPRLDPVAPSPIVSFEFPVFAPKSLDELDALNEVLQCKMRVGNASFDPVECHALPAESGGTPAFVPDDTRVMLLVFRLPRSLLRQRATVRVNYFQPHYQFAGNEIAAYLPLLPDFEEFKNELLFSRQDFSVSFEAVEAVRLHRLTANAAVRTDTPKQVRVEAVHREMIAVAVAPAAPAPEPKPPSASQ